MYKKQRVAKLRESSQLTLERLSPVSVEVEVSATTTQSSSPSFVTFLVILGYLLGDLYVCISMQHTHTQTHTHSLSLSETENGAVQILCCMSNLSEKVTTNNPHFQFLILWMKCLFVCFIVVICCPLFCWLYCTSNEGNKQLQQCQQTCLKVQSAQAGEQTVLKETL